jgi:PPM family protein phosphatase
VIGASRTSSRDCFLAQRRVEEVLIPADACRPTKPGASCGKNSQALKRHRLSDTPVIVLDWGSSSDVGRVRQLNEDSVLAMAPVFLVADGMGGHAAGEIASALTVEVFGALATLDGSLTSSDIRTALRTANDVIMRAASSSDARNGMGTTAVGLVVVKHDDEEALCAFNLGDSRVYRLSGGSLEQVSKDHSLVQELVDRGDISDEQAKTHKQRNVITRMLGSDEPVDPDIWLLPAVVGDRYLVCSDGLTTEVSDDRLVVTLSQYADARLAAGHLVEAALSHGGRDNVSVIVIDVVGVDSSSEVLTTKPRLITDLDEETKPRAQESEAAVGEDTLDFEAGCENKSSASGPVQDSGTPEATAP